MGEEVRRYERHPVSPAPAPATEPADQEEAAPYSPAAFFSRAGVTFRRGESLIYAGLGSRGVRPTD